MKDYNIRDIAKLANVGVSTVSRVINDHPDVKKETRDKILSIIDEYNYIPNNSARNLKLLNGNHIGVLVRGSFNPFFSQIVELIEKKINANNYSMILHYNINDLSDDSESIIEQVKEKRLGGVIYLGGNFNNDSMVHLKSLNIPLVLASSIIETDSDTSFFSSVRIDNVQSAYHAVDYLCQIGHKNIALLSPGMYDVKNGLLRRRGYEKALNDHGITIDEKYIIDGTYTFNSGFEMAKTLIESNPEITAIFATSDIMAVGAAKYLLSSGKEIPEDISIIGFDGLEYSQFFHPALSTVKQPIEAIAFESVKLLFDLLENPENKTQQITLKTELLVRDSVIKIKEHSYD
ncbi:MAG: LacI family DNA-binding transcriptional regulator [Clostridiales bacterium]|nr:LacI family DNA-binding transcriptional regulator [Clostridiales bacterium]